jgi:hypothetical protein
MLGFLQSPPRVKKDKPKFTSQLNHKGIDFETSEIKIADDKRHFIHLIATKHDLQSIIWFGINQPSTGLIERKLVAGMNSLAKTIKMRKKDTIKIFLQRSDFDIREHKDSGIIKNYSDGDDCPLARAVKRQLDAKYVKVEGFDYGLNIDGVKYSNTNQWDYKIAENVAKCMLAGDETHYYVTIKKV